VSKDSASELKHWAALADEALYAALASGPRGLSATEAARRFAVHGPNALDRVRRRASYLVLAEQFVHFFAILLWIAAALAWVAAMPQLGVAIVAVILINGVFSFWQQYQAERAVEALEDLLPRQTIVRRDGRDTLVRHEQVVRGDLLVLSEGAAVPADARLVVAESLRLDASSLTGESRPLSRTHGAVLAEGASPGELKNLVYAGTAVTSGRGLAVVYATAAHTEFGRIATLTLSQVERPSPMQIEVSHITRVITVLALVLGGLSYLVGTLAGGLSPRTAFLFAVGVIVANVPEGLLPTLSLALALGVKRMARRQALVKKLSTVEALGATTVILTDKTGTLTQNEMTVREAWAGGIAFRFAGAGFARSGGVEAVAGSDGDDVALEEMLRAAGLCCNARVLDERGADGRWRVLGDPTEGAILVAAAKLGLDTQELASIPRLGELPFDSTRKRMTTVNRLDGEAVACVKGAPAELLGLCASWRRRGLTQPLDGPARGEAEAALAALSARGLRVLGVATRRVAVATPVVAAEVERELTLLGFIAMEDPPRPEVPQAIAKCRAAGIRVIMVTGDDGRTAAAVGGEIGLHSKAPRVVSGAELDRLDDRALDALVAEPELLVARATPEHKLRLVEAFQRRGEVVAVTGDGVNDAPALKRADVGIAMGMVGTDVAREAADMILADDNFATIAAAVEEGRGVYDNVRKFVTYILASNVPELVPFMAFVLLGIPLPLTVMQILAVDLGTDLLPALALGAERPEPDVMSRPPRRRDRRLLDGPTLLRAYAWLGLIEAGLGLGGFFCAYLLAGWRPGEAMVATGPLYVMATTMSLAGIVACQVGNVFACRSAQRSLRRTGLGGNRLLLAALVVEVVVFLGLVHVPPLAAVFGLGPLAPALWVVLAFFPAILIALEEWRKALARQIRTRL